MGDSASALALTKLLPSGKIEAWCDGDEEEPDDDLDEWIVGVRLSSHSWFEIATCKRGVVARAIAEHLDALPDRGK